MPPILSLSNAGYRRFGPLPASGGGLAPQQAASAAARAGDYEAAGEWVRRSARRRGRAPSESFRIIDTLDAGSELTNGRLSFVDDYFASAFANTGTPRLTTESGNIEELVATAASERRPLAMYRLEQALALAGPQRLKPVLRDLVAPCFFRLYPQGKVAVVRYDDATDDAAALMRTLYAASQTPLADVRRGGPGGIDTLKEWHLGSVTLLGPLLFNLFLHLFYPSVGGYRAGLGGLDFIFLFDPAEAYEPALYPRDWLAVASSSADFGREGVDLFGALRDFRGPAWQRAAHQRFRHEKGYSAEERLALLGWYVGRANRLAYELADVANFTEGNAPDGAIDPVFAFEHQLTVDRLARKTLLSMSLAEAGAAKLMAFDVAEVYDGLSKMLGGHADGSAFFKRLFDTAEGPAAIRGPLGTLPPPFGTDLPALAGRLYGRIEDAVIESVWLKAKVSAGGVMVRKKKDMAQEELVPRPKFVAELMRAYRNAHHGYFTAADRDGKRPSRYLFLVDGDLPAEINALPALWWLAYLADPGLVGWRPLGIGVWD